MIMMTLKILNTKLRFGSVLACLLDDSDNDNETVCIPHLQLCQVRVLLK